MWWLLGFVAVVVTWFVVELIRAPQQPPHRDGDKPWET